MPLRYCETDAAFRTYSQPVSGEKIRKRAQAFADHSQARLFFWSQSEIEQNHMINALTFELSKVTLPHIRARFLLNLRNVDEEFAQSVCDGLGVELPPASKSAAPVQDVPPSPALRLIGKYPEKRCPDDASAFS